MENDYKRKQTVAIVGGAFDPPTIAHLAIAKAVLKLPEIDMVWLSPCFSHMFNKTMSDPEQRLAMCREMLKYETDIEASVFEVVKKLDTPTYSVMQEYHKEWPEWDFRIVIGQDNANCIRDWCFYPKIIQEEKFIVVPRGELVCETTWYMHDPHKFMLFYGENPIPDISSTMARETVRKWWNGDVSIGEISKYVHPKVIDYILENGIYRESDS